MAVRVASADAPGVSIVDGWSEAASGSRPELYAGGEGRFHRARESPSDGRLVHQSFVGEGHHHSLVAFVVNGRTILPNDFPSSWAVVSTVVPS